jgi:hypothetical protein
MAIIYPLIRWYLFSTATLTCIYSLIKKQIKGQLLQLPTRQELTLRKEENKRVEPYHFRRVQCSLYILFFACF